MNATTKKQMETTCGTFTIQREANGFRVIETKTGIAIATLDTYAEAVKTAQEADQMKWLVKTISEDEAINLVFRHGLKAALDPRLR